MSNHNARRATHAKSNTNNTNAGNTNPGANYETAGPKETQQTLKKQFGKGAREMWEKVKVWANKFVTAFKIVGKRFWKGLMYVATRAIEIAGTCIMAIPAIIASTAKLVFGILKWTASIITLGVVMVVGAVVGAVAWLINGFLGILAGLEALFGKAAVSTWRQTKKTGRSRKFSTSYKTVKETVEEPAATPSAGPQAQPQAA